MNLAWFYVRSFPVVVFLSQTNERAQTITLNYNSLNQLTSKTTPEQTYAYTYDIFGNVSTAANSAGTLSNTYDSAKRLASQEFIPNAGYQGFATSYTYNSLDQRTSMVDSAGGQVLYGYDTASRLSSINSNGQAIALSWDGLNRLGQLRTLGLDTAYTYSNSGLASILHSRVSDSNIQNSLALQRNLMGFVSQSQSTSATENYSYDSGPYLSGVTRSVSSIGGTSPLSSPATESFTYDN